MVLGFGEIPHLSSLPTRNEQAPFVIDAILFPLFYSSLRRFLDQNKLLFDHLEGAVRKRVPIRPLAGTTLAFIPFPFE